MADPHHLAIFKEGVSAWNKWREILIVSPDLQAIKLEGENLMQANLRRTNLQKTNLRYANLREVNLWQANLQGADLQGVNLQGGNVGEADFERALLGNTLFSNMDLSTIKHLETCKHYGPSSIDFQTLENSGPLPLAFLRGCGLSEWEIEATKLYSKSLSREESTLITYEILRHRHGDPLQFKSCFISHSTKDAEFAERLHNDLQNQGVRCWYAPEHLKGGEKLYDQIDSAIRLHDKLLLLLADASMKSEWVITELHRTLEAERKQGRRKLFPLGLVDFETIRKWECFDADTGKDLAKLVREYHIPDFTNWKDPGAYQIAFKRLLKDLREETLIKTE